MTIEVLLTLKITVRFGFSETKTCLKLETVFIKVMWQLLNLCGLEILPRYLDITQQEEIGT